MAKKNNVTKCKTIILHSGKPIISISYIGTSRVPKTRRDRWGKLEAGAIRRIYLDMLPLHQTLDIPQSWFDNASNIHVRLIAEVNSCPVSGKSRK